MGVAFLPVDSDARGMALLLIRWLARYGYNAALEDQSGRRFWTDAERQARKMKPRLPALINAEREARHGPAVDGRNRAAGVRRARPVEEGASPSARVLAAHQKRMAAEEAATFAAEPTTITPLPPVPTDETTKPGKVPR